MLGFNSPPDKTKEEPREVCERFVFEVLKEQRNSRRWGIFFKLLTFAYLFLLLGLALQLDTKLGEAGAGSSDKHTALIKIDGVISDDSEASADNIAKGLRKAFEDKNTAGIILRINSPGGSPVQSGYVNDEIHRLREKYPAIPVYAVVTDLCASGGYYIAAAADKIYADKSSIVGSIGVVMNGFGFVGSLEKLGVERRLLTAGEHKGLLDAFSPVKPEEVEHIQSLLDNMHQQFIEVVKKGRGDRLKDESSLFSGLVWSGEQALDNGLVDALGSSGYVAREVIGEDNIVDFTAKKDYWERMAERLGTSMGRVFASQLGLTPRIE